MTSFLETAIEAAKGAGDLQMAGLVNKPKIEFKGEIDLVTDVDRACEKLILEKIQGRFPDHDFVAEEGSGKRRDSEFKWIVDPLDGTTNFAHGYPLFCTSIALEQAGVVILGVVYEPNRDELFWAEKGKGAYLLKNASTGAGTPQRLSVSETATLKTSLLVTGFAYNLRESRNNNIDHFNNMLLAAQAVRRDGVAAVDLCYVACGRYDGFWELNLFPWDVAAGVLILNEAGGQVTRFAGEPFSVYDKDILATNGRIHESIMKVLAHDTDSTSN